MRNEAEGGNGDWKNASCPAANYSLYLNDGAGYCIQTISV